MVHVLSTEDYYDILLANERLLEDSHQVHRFAVKGPRNVKLQKEYLQKAANLGVIPKKFSRSPLRPRREELTSAPSASATQRPVPPPGFGGGRPSRNRIAKELARADSAYTSNSAGAALAATQALYRGLVPLSCDPQTKGARSDTSSDSEQSSGSSSTAQSAVVTAHEGNASSWCDIDSYVNLSSDDSSVTSQRDGSPTRRSGSVPRELERFVISERSSATGGGLDGSSSRGKAYRGPSAGVSGRPRPIGAGGVKGTTTTRLLKEPTPAFLRRWRSARNRRTTKKQAVRFLLRSPGDGEPDGRGGRRELTCRESTLPEYGAQSLSSNHHSDANTGGGSRGLGASPSGGGVFIVYPGSSIIFPAQPLPYSLAEALEIVQQQQQQQPRTQLGARLLRDEAEAALYNAEPGLMKGGTRNDIGTPPSQLHWATPALDEPDPVYALEQPSQQHQQQPQELAAQRRWGQISPRLQYQQTSPVQSWDLPLSPHGVLSQATAPLDAKLPVTATWARPTEGLEQQQQQLHKNIAEPYGHPYGPGAYDMPRGLSSPASPTDVLRHYYSEGDASSSLGVLSPHGARVILGSDHRSLGSIESSSLTAGEMASAAPPRPPKIPQPTRLPASALPSGSPPGSVGVMPMAGPTALPGRWVPSPVDVSGSPATQGSDALPSPSTPPAPPTADQLEAAAAFPEDPQGSIDGRSSTMSGGPSFGGWAVQRDVPSRKGTSSVGSGAPDSAVSLQSLRNHQSAITRDVEALMQRLADMKGRLDK